MILEYLAPGARRRRHTAGTTEAGLLGLLDVIIHGKHYIAGRPESQCTVLKNGKVGNCEEFSIEIGGAGRDRTADKGFADLCLTTWRPRLKGKLILPEGIVVLLALLSATTTTL
jgi:hypothetical protein